MREKEKGSMTEGDLQFEMKEILKWQDNQIKNDFDFGRFTSGAGGVFSLICC